MSQFENRDSLTSLAGSGSAMLGAKHGGGVDRKAVKTRLRLGALGISVGCTFLLAKDPLVGWLLAVVGLGLVTHAAWLMRRLRRA